MTAQQAGSPLPLNQALALIDTLPPVTAAPERVSLEQAAGRILASPARARIPVPRFTNSAVDGWAIRAADLDAHGRTRLPVLARLPAGCDAAGVLARGGAVRIFTGAMMPDDADTVVMQEHARVEGETVVLPEGVIPGANVRVAGSFQRTGNIVLPAGRRLAPHDLALAAAVGLDGLEVRPSLRVALLTTGDEIRPVGAELPPATIPDQNGAMLGALLDTLGVRVTRLPSVGDDRPALAATLERAVADHDLVVTSGGVSVGEEDHLGPLIAGRGRLLFWRVALKPGRPAALAMFQGTPVLALPGNPVAAFTVFHALGQALVRRLGGRPPANPARMLVKARFSRRKTAGLRHLLPVRLESTESFAEAIPSEIAGSSALTSLVGSDGFVEIAEGCTDVSPGDLLPFRPFFEPPGA